jgi:hypothetical protein
VLVGFVVHDVCAQPETTATDQIAMTTSSSSRLVLVLLANVVLASSVACGGSGASADPDPAADPGPARNPDDQTAGADAGSDAPPKAPPVGGPTTQGDLTDDLGIFVTTSGNDAASGTHDQPLASVQAGIDKAKTVGKRVYVCAGTFKESLTLADSISVVGGLDCTNNQWSTGSGRTRIEATSSPAVRAKDIATATRIEGLDVVAPNATTSSGSSIALLADHANALTVAHSQLIAGDAKNGDNGALAVQLSNAATTKGGEGSNQLQCITGTPGCDRSVITNDWVATAGGSGGVNVCVGAPGHVGQAGGKGGSGGLIQFHQTMVNGIPFILAGVYEGNNAFARTDSPDARTGAAGADGTDGLNGSANVASGDGYVPADGVNGSDGMPGFGGAGGDGVTIDSTLTHVLGQVWRGVSAAGGGAGGCPGLAGSAGKGGGASIAALVIESAITFEGAALSSGQGGAGGLGTFGSGPTAGGAPGSNPRPAQSVLSGDYGGRGGLAGVSGNGGNGPSVGILYVGTAPSVTAGTTITPGKSAPAIDARSNVDGLSGLAKTIPATPAGVSKDVLAL